MRHAVSPDSIDRTNKTPLSCYGRRSATAPAWRETIVQFCSYKTDSLAEASSFMAREWSRHQIDSARPTMKMRFRRRIISPSVTLSSLSYGAGIRIRPIEREPVMLVQMPSAGNAVARFRDAHVAINRGSHAILDVRHMQDAAFDEDFDMLVLRIQVPRLMLHLENLLGRKPRHDLRFAGSVTEESSQWQEWGLVYQSLLALNACDSADISSRVMAPLEDMILSTLLVVLPNNYSDDINGVTLSIAPKHVRRAESYIRDTTATPSVADVAAHVGVSVRALFEGFKTFRKVTPGEFIRNVRLDNARRDLLAGKGTVTEIALNCGYAHAGHFAGRYRERFGELPAQTLRSAGAYEI